jgi:hypothetical protein
MKHQPKRLLGFPFLPAALVLVFLAGCLANYGRLQIDRAVEQSFRNHEMLADYQYYHSGRQNKPSAIIGIDPAFVFIPSKQWTAIEPSQFATMVDRMYPDFSFLYGAYILAPDGRRAGVWYAWVNTFTAKFKEDRIIVFSPEPNADVNGGSVFEDHH